jgi:hypothetical protein
MGFELGGVWGAAMLSAYMIEVGGESRGEAEVVRAALNAPHCESFGAERVDWVDAGGAAGWDIASQ